MNRPIITAMGLAVTLLVVGAVAAEPAKGAPAEAAHDAERKAEGAARAAGKGEGKGERKRGAEGKADAEGDRKGKGDAEGDAKAKAKKDPKKATAGDEKPACMRCGATCGLEPVCVCEPGTKNRPKAEFEVECAPVFIAGCGTPFGRRTGCTEGRASVAGGCTTCGPEACECRGRIRFVKKLERKNVDEEVPTVVRKVKYLCDCCAGRCAAGCCGPAPRPSWWSRLLPW